jgi:drug/metabolite transporter (DMT)-like permease
MAEIALALHPILLKQIPTNLTTQLIARLGTYSVGAYAFASPQQVSNTLTSWSSMAYGLMNLIHISSSYESYKHLPAGTALSLFYLYPFFNIIGASLFLKESFDTSKLPFFLTAFLGVLLISKYTKDDDAPSHKEDDDEKESFEDSPPPQKNTMYGIIMSIVSALTETMIFLLTKSNNESSPWGTMLQLYPGALLALGAYTLYNKTQISTTPSVWTPLLLFNIFIGFIGYSLRFFSIPLLPTTIFSLLTFIGVAAGYGWGLMYAKEVPSWGALAGAGLITGSLVFL